MGELWFDIPRENIQWFPKVDYPKCVGCLICVNRCPHKVYSEENGKPVVSNPNGCVVGCNGCDKFCPVGAISHPPREYLEKLLNRKDFEAGCSCSDGCSCSSSCGCGGK